MADLAEATIKMVTTEGFMSFGFPRTTDVPTTLKSRNWMNVVFIMMSFLLTNRSK